MNAAASITAEQPQDATAPQRAEAERLYRVRATQLWSFGRRLGLTAGEADDAVHEAFVRLVASIGPRWPATPDAWLFRVVHNLAVDAHRRGRFASMRAHVVEIVADDQPGASDRLDRIALWAAVDALPVRQRAAIYLRYRADLDFAAIAEVLGISESGARGDCFRALASLRRKVRFDD